MNKKRILFGGLYAALFLILSGCGADTQESIPMTSSDIQETMVSSGQQSEQFYLDDTQESILMTSSNIQETVISSGQQSEQFYLDATWVVASTIRVESGFYFAEYPVQDTIVHDIFRQEDGLGSEILSRHPYLEGMEFIIILNEKNFPLNVFVYQPNTDPVSMACAGEYDNISDWGFASWSDVLEEHFELSTLDSSEFDTSQQD